MLVSYPDPLACSMGMRLGRCVMCAICTVLLPSFLHTASDQELEVGRPGNEASNVELTYLSNSMWTTTPGQSPSQNRRYWALMGEQWGMEVRG